MKKLIAFALTVFIYNSVFSQANRFYRAEESTKMYLNGLAQQEVDTDLLIEALEAINETVLNEKMSQKAKTWYYNGLINHLIFQNEEIRAGNPDALFIASSSYQKALTMEDSKFSRDQEDIAKEQLFNLTIEFYNEGVRLYSLKDFDNAYKMFMEVRAIDNFFEAHPDFEQDPDDADATYNAALCLFKLDKREEAKGILKDLIENEYDSPAIYQILSGFYIEEEDNENALKYLALGIERYPDNLGLRIDELNIFLNNGQETEAIERMEKAVEIDPSNAQIQYALGVAYDKTMDYAKSEAAYLKAVELDPEYFNAYNNLGALFYNQGIAINKELSDNMKLTDSQYKKMTAERDELYKKALPYFERAYEINNSSISILQGLKEIYARLAMYDKSKAMKQKIAEVQGNK